MTIKIKNTYTKPWTIERNIQSESTTNSCPHFTTFNNLTLEQVKFLIIFCYLSKVKEIKKTEVKKVNLIKEFIPYINDLSLTEKSIFDSIYSYLKLSKKDYFKVSEKYLKQIQGGFFDQNEKIEQNEKIKKPKLIVRFFKAIVNQFIDKQSFINRIIKLFSNWTIKPFINLMKTSFSLTLIIGKDFYQIFKFIYFKCAWFFYLTISFYIAKYILNKYILTTILFTSNKGLLDLDSKFNLQSKFNKKDVFNRHFFDERPNFIWQERLHKMLKDEKKFKVIKESIYTKLLKHHEGMVKMLNKVEQIQLRAESINLPLHIRMKALKIYKRVKQSLKKCLLVNEAVKRQLKDHLTFVEMPARKRLFKSIHELRYIESPDLLNEIMSELADEFNFIELDDTIPNLEKMYKDKANYLNQKLNLLKNKK